MPVIPAIQEAETGSKFKASLNNLARLCLKIKFKKTGMELSCTAVA
jgi:hypothetical protein